MSLIDLHKVNQLLCIGAHCDDIEIGAGATILRLIQHNPAIRIRWVILTGADKTRAAEARQSAAQFCAGAAKLTVDILGFKDGFLPWQGEQVKLAFEALKQDISPDLIFTHHGHDRHQDHRLCSELSWNTWRNHSILEYEILKWDGDLGQPNVFVPVEQDLSERKVDYIYQNFVSQHARPWFDKDTFLALMRVRGVECHAAFAEAFYARKLVC